MLAAVLYYLPDPVPFVVLTTFGVVTNLYLHESIHYYVESKLGFEPVFSWPSAVYVPDQPKTTREAVASLLSPQILTVIYLVVIVLSRDWRVDYMVAIALVFNVFGGFRGLAWAVRRITWPEGHLVLVDPDEREWVAFPE
jgi:hypothetical protein